jgi:glucosyl-dolichyl phosphate glucuronosyltransferase
MNISIIICTHNRCQSLQRTLQTCCGLEIPAGLQWELVVVDNDSTDATRKVCESFSGRLLRYQFEGLKGKSHALNAGAVSGKGELLLFTDDDVDVHAQWVMAMWDAYRRYPDRQYFGGRVLPLWENPPPAWVLRHYSELPHLAQLDWGEQERFARTEMGEYFPGANSAFPARVFAEGHRYTGAVGLLADDARRGYIVGGEDMEFLRTIAHAGWRGVYIPGAVVAHRHTAARCTERYLRKWYVGSGMMLVRLEKEKAASGIILGAPRYLWRQLVMATSRYVLGRWTCSSKVWLSAECTMALTWGMIVEYRQAREVAQNRN